MFAFDTCGMVVSMSAPSQMIELRLFSWLTIQSLLNHGSSSVQVDLNWLVCYLHGHWQ